MANISVNFKQSSDNPKICVELSLKEARQLIDSHKNVTKCIFNAIKIALEWAEKNRAARM